MIYGERKSIARFEIYFRLVFEFNSISHLIKSIRLPICLTKRMTNGVYRPQNNPRTLSLSAEGLTGVLNVFTPPNAQDGPRFYK